MTAETQIYTLNRHIFCDTYHILSIFVIKKTAKMI